MANELILYDTFKKILSKSKVIEGRFVVLSGYSSDLNSDNFGQIFKDSLGSIKNPRKYPIACMFPPVEILNGYDDANWSLYKIQLFFFAQPHTINYNPLANTSNHTIAQTWKDMTVCGKNFRKAFIRVTENNKSNPIRDGQSKDVIQRYSKVGVDGVAGIGIDFDISIFNPCDLDDYNDNEIDQITITKKELHPHHKY